jgi:hypothetical protein
LANINPVLNLRIGVLSFLWQEASNCNKIICR